MMEQGSKWGKAAHWTPRAGTPSPALQPGLTTPVVPFPGFPSQIPPDLCRQHCSCRALRLQSPQLLLGTASAPQASAHLRIRHMGCAGNRECGTARTPTGSPSSAARFTGDTASSPNPAACAVLQDVRRSFQRVSKSKHNCSVPKSPVRRSQGKAGSQIGLKSK